MKSLFSSNILNTVLKVTLSTALIIAIIKITGPLPLSVNTKTLDKDSTFFVSAEASAFVTPDIASVILSIEYTAPTATEAQTQANKVINRIKDDMKKLGVEDKNIRTTSYNIYPNYISIPAGQPYYVPPTNKIESYRAQTSLRVRVKDFAKLNEILDTATADGVNNVSDISFEVEDKDKAIEEARKEAIKKAKDKANKIAGEAKIKLGRILNVSEYYPYDYQYSEKAMIADGGNGNSGQTQLQPGQTEIKVNVSLSYETL